MKSEKAREYLNNSSMHPNSPLAQDQHYVWRDTAVIRAVELAEQEAEERMRVKAIEAYCTECICDATGICVLEPDVCDRKQIFIQKLNEE